MAGKLVAFPERGAFRVHRAPTVLVRRPDPHHRFDDPENDYGVWYFATTLRGAMIEVVDHWRVNPATETALSNTRGVTGLDILDPAGGDTAGSVPLAFLTTLKLAKGFVEPSPGKAFLNVMDEDFLSELNLHPRIRAALAAGGTDAFGDPPTLNFGNIQAAHPAARRLTQALSRVIYEDDRELAGIRYISRHTEDEECWAVFDSDARPAPLRLRDPELVLPTSHHHRTAVNEAAALLRVELPDVWAG